MKLEDLRKRLRRGIEPKRAKKSSSGDSKPRPVPKIRKVRRTCGTCSLRTAIELVVFDYPVKDVKDMILGFVKRAGWRCERCGTLNMQPIQK